MEGELIQHVSPLILDVSENQLISCLGSVNIHYPLQQILLLWLEFYDLLPREL